MSQHLGYYVKNLLIIIGGVAKVGAFGATTNTASTGGFGFTQNNAASTSGGLFSTTNKVFSFYPLYFA